MKGIKRLVRVSDPSIFSGYASPRIIVAASGTIAVGTIDVTREAANRACMAQGSCIMSNTVEELRKAIEGLIDAKLHDALYRPGGLERLRAHRMTGVASPDIRNAERKLDEVLEAAAQPQPSASAYRRRPRKIVEELEYVSTD